MKEEEQKYLYVKYEDLLAKLVYRYTPNNDEEKGG